MKATSDMRPGMSVRIGLAGASVSHYSKKRLRQFELDTDATIARLSARGESNNTGGHETRAGQSGDA